MVIRRLLSSDVVAEALGGSILVEAEVPRNMLLPLPLGFKTAVQIFVDFG
jgi:hypothetical protein